MSFIGDIKDRAAIECPERFLFRFGYRMREEEPLLTIELQGHSEVNGHTLYEMHCRHCWVIKGQEQPNQLTWTARARLADLRAQLHDPIKEELGSQYGKFFHGVSFASHGGVPGTTNKLKAWLARLASTISAGETTPSIVCRTLRFLQAPVQDSSDNDLAGNFGRCKACTLHTGSSQIKRCSECKESWKKERKRLLPEMRVRV
eukprot:TRINITY_DN47884_c0_g1_i1.p1 TRINITY_DN47884_c0_g1~~TRINITY_DN47884_c0_g1_i1.p1  ORF type:complete len:203 (+),score=46.95 TRINITY_DN47884_c0_g1_i1:55-663(+)